MRKALCFIAVFFLIACSNDSNTSYFELSQSSFALNKPQQTITVHISCNSSWQATDIPSWITLQQTQGNGDADLQIVVSQNNDQDGQTRTGIIKFISDNKVYLLTIVQTAANSFPITIVNNEVHHLDYNQHVFTIQISSTQPWYIQSKPAWVQVNPSTGNAGITSVEITIPENNTISNRGGSTIFATENPFNANNPTYTVLDIDQTISPILPNPNSPTLYDWDLIKGDVDVSLNYARSLSSDFKNNTYYLMHTTQSTGHIDKFNGSWSNYGDINSFDYPKMTVGNNGIPYAIYYQNGPKVCQFNPSINNIPFPASTSWKSSMDLDSNNDIYLSNSSINSSSGNIENLSIYKYNSSWLNIGNFNEFLIINHIIKIDANNIPYIAYNYRDQTGSYNLVVKSFNGSSWTTVGGSVVDNSSGEIDFQIGTDNSLYLTYNKNNTSYVKKFNNGSWSTIGFFNGFIFRVFLDNNNNPYIFCNGKIKKLVNSQWVELEPFKIIYNNQVIDYSGYELQDITMSFDQENKLIVAFIIGGNLSLKVLRYRN
ncbi:hypothetical protein Q361_10181 [Flavobacterium croceum DSM 17960]|uniref:BACON domain-containing protein n=1 Tax=Flavobacterium croceum DSM 17960 TaxID=1121886 RepID=A0A2S4NC07_9FLAO|nr:BACON domain-containing carbohydrate-binding protein [Flavobacterium croceum]POS02983.1 hypothetical protein Q361_10181 [Flavobacterium croceum DSM 17960]